MSVLDISKHIGCLLNVVGCGIKLMWEQSTQLGNLSFEVCLCFSLRESFLISLYLIFTISSWVVLKIKLLVHVSCFKQCFVWYSHSNVNVLCTWGGSKGAQRMWEAIGEHWSEREKSSGPLQLSPPFSILLWGCSVFSNQLPLISKLTCPTHSSSKDSHSSVTQNNSQG